jgi:small subunit ribosomal protein S2
MQTLVREARNLDIPVFGVVDTNANPDRFDYVIPAMTMRSRGLQLLLDYFVAAVSEGAGR